MPKRDTDLPLQRAKALYIAYKKALDKIYETSPRGHIPADAHVQAIRMAVKTPQPRFWITQDRAYRILRAILRGHEPTPTWVTRSSLNRELLNAYYRLSKQRMFRDMPLRFITDFVTLEPASGFFMSVSRAGRAISAYRKYLKQHHDYGV